MTKNLAYMHRSFPGLLSPLVGFISSKKLTNAVFLAERWAREVYFPSVRKVRIPGPAPGSAPKTLAWQSADGRMTHMMRNALRAGDTLLRLRKGGFVPDIIYATVDEGYLLYVKDVFPKARIVLRLGSFYSPDVWCEDAKTGRMDNAKSDHAATGRVQNCFTLSALNDCHLAFVSSTWQQKMFDKVSGGEKIQLIPSAVDSQLFYPTSAPSKEEIVTFACQGTNPARGIQDICACLPDLLAQRAQCRVRMVSFASSHTAVAIQQHTEALEALLPPMNSELRNRVEVVVSPRQDIYAELLRSSTVYVYLTSAATLSAGILEAMSCGILVMASDTGPVRELVSHGENGFLCTAHDSQTVTSLLVELLGKAPDLAQVGRAARETVLEGHDLRKLLPLHATLALGN